MMTNPERKALLLDTTRCIGCGACSQACKERNRLPRTSDDVLTDKLSDRTFTVVNRQGSRFVRRLCMHCEVPSCVSACPVGAFRKTAAGPVVYDETRCMGCRYCMLACPFNVPKYEWGKTLPRVRKCDMCAERLAQGLATACATACPTGATKFGIPRRAPRRGAGAASRPSRTATTTTCTGWRRWGARRCSSSPMSGPRSSGCGPTSSTSPRRC